MKHCNDCDLSRPLEDFYKNRAQKDGLQSYCIPCWKVRTKNTYRKNGYRYQKTARLRKTYGITSDDFDAMTEAQSGACAICHKPEQAHINKGRLSVDHCHATGRVRGLLCNRCNKGLGLFLDDSEALITASNYLRNY